jgi:hypothetical protein
MTTLEPTTVASARAGALQTLGLLALGLIPWPGTWAFLSGAIENARSPELNRAEREVDAAGYYEGLIGGDDGPQGARGELALRLMGKPSGWVRFSDADVSRLLEGDFLQFELKPNIRRSLFGKPFETNSHGIPGGERTIDKPPGTWRIAALGSSMDMGWGVSNRESYANRLETWLNSHARLQGLDEADPPRRFEVLNFAVAAYSPMQRLDSYLRKARPFRPDLVLYSATMLDLRLMEIHLCDLLRSGVDLKYDFLREAVAQARIEAEDLALDENGKLVFKERIKAKLQPFYWSIYDATIRALAEECRADGAALAFVIIPRVGKADAPDARAEPVAHLKAIAAHSGLDVYDLSGTFDRFDPAELEIAAWDDHPNALGHQRLFLGLARAMARDRATYRMLFPKGSPVDSPQSVPLEDGPSHEYH